MTSAAVVTGGTRGIGRAVTLALARSGRPVHALYVRDHPAAADLTAQAQREQLEIVCECVNLADDGAVAKWLPAVIKERASVDTLIHCAASGVHRDVTVLTPKHLRWTFGVNVFGIHSLVTALVPHMPAGSRIIGITSAGSKRALPHYAAIGTSKGALESLFRYYAQELAPKGITANLVCPGMVHTNALDSFPDKERRIKHALDFTPTGRLTTPDDVASLVIFLCTEGASQIVGQTITVDGGRTLT